MRGTLIAAATVAVLAGCSTYDSVTQRIAQSITPYRITVVQGHFVSAEAAAHAYRSRGALPALRHFRVDGEHALTEERFDAIVDWVTALRY